MEGANTVIIVDEVGKMSSLVKALLIQFVNCSHPHKPHC